MYSSPDIRAPAAADTAGSCQVTVRLRVVSGDRRAKASAASVALSAPRPGAIVNAAPGPPSNGSRRASAARPRITLAPTVVAALAGRVAEVGEDLLGADPDLLGMEFEAECSHLGLLLGLVASRNRLRATLTA